MRMKSAKNKGRVPLQLIGAAGVHFVVSELSLRGLIALPTARNTAGIDVLVSEPDGNALASLQVKTSLGKTSSWLTYRPLQGPRVFYVFLRYIKSEKRFEGFLESSEEVAKQVRRNLRRDYQRRGRKGFSVWKLPSSPEGVEQLRQRWETWRPPA